MLKMDSSVYKFGKDHYRDVNKTLNSVDPDQTAQKEQSDQGLHCLHKQKITTCPNMYLKCQRLPH